MKIEIFGVGCPKCKKTEAIILDVLAKTGIQAEVEHVTDLNAIVARGVMMTPAVFVDGVKVMEGRVPREAEAAAFLRK